MGLDFHFKTWKWSQWLSLVGLFQVFIVFFSNPFAFAGGINFRLTLLMFGLLLLCLFNFLYVIGFYVGMEQKRYLIQMAIPYGLILADIIFFYLLNNAVTAMVVFYMSFLKLFLSVTIYNLTLVVCYNKIEFIYEDLSDLELYELGVTDIDPRKVDGGVSVLDRTNKSPISIK